MSASIFRKRPAWLKAKGESPASPETTPLPLKAEDDAEHLDMFSRSAHTLTWAAEGHTRRSQQPTPQEPPANPHHDESARVKRRRLSDDNAPDSAPPAASDKETTLGSTKQSSNCSVPLSTRLKGTSIARASPSAHRSSVEPEGPPGDISDLVVLKKDGSNASEDMRASTTKLDLGQSTAKEDAPTTGHSGDVSDDSLHSGDDVDFDKLLKRAKKRRLQATSDSPIHSSRARGVGDAPPSSHMGAANPTPAPPGAAPRPAAKEADPVLKILVHSKIPDTTPIFGNVRLTQPLKILRVTWCKKQGFDDDFTSSVFLTWRGFKIFDMTNCRSLGVSVDAVGDVFWKVKPGHSGPTEGSQNLEMEAWTPDLFEKECLGQNKLQRSEATSVADNGPDTKTAGKGQVKIIVKAKGYEDYKLLVKPDTTFGKIINAFRKTRGVAPEREAFLMFDGEKMDERSVVRDVDISDLDEVDLYIR